MPQQALALANSDVSLNAVAPAGAASSARWPASDAEPDQAFVPLAYEQILGREPTERRTQRVPRRFCKSQAELLRDPAKLTAIRRRTESHRSSRRPIRPSGPART